ncbi:MAG: lamin tail domain-containing protein, partial [Bacteroidota bacterium]
MLNNRHFSFLLLLLLLAGFSPGLWAQSLEMTVGDANGQADTDVTVDVTVKNFNAIFNYQGTVVYDDNVLEFVSVASPQAASGIVNIIGVPGPTNTIPNNKFTFLWTDPNAVGVNLLDDAVVMTITFHIKAGVADGTTSTVSIDGSETGLGFGEAINFTFGTYPVTDGTVSVGSAVVTVPPPTVNDISVCEGGSTEITPVGTPSTFNFYDADPTAGSANLLSGPSASYDPGTTPASSPQTIWVTTVDAGNESTPVSLTVTVDALPVLTALTPIICESDASSIDLTTYQSAITSSAGSFSWSTGGATISELFISEYVEGSSNNKYIEIYNGTGADVDLSDYELRLFSNGNTNASNTNTLSGILADGDVVVYSNSSASVYLGTTINASAVGFNGDDAIGLFNTATNSYADIFGHIGEDPGSQWSVSGNNTAKQSLVRN